MKKLSRIFLVIAIIVSHVMCAFVAYVYRGMLCAIEHAGFSAPADVAFFYAIPFLVITFLCLIISFVLNKKSKK